MAYTVLGSNKMLNGINYALGSLHSGFPGELGSNELSGGSYARQTLAVATASGEQRSMTGPMNFPVPAATVRWVGMRDSIGDFVAYAPNGGTPLEFVVDTAADTILSPGHGLSNGQEIVFYKGTVPAPLVEGTIYFVVGATTNAFQVATTSGGAAINLTSAGTSACQVSSIFEDVYAAPGTHIITASIFALNF